MATVTSKSNEFLAAIYQLAEDNDLDKEIVLQVIEKAILTAYRKHMKEEEITEEDLINYSVDIDETGEFTILADKKVVSKVTDARTQILESQAKLFDSRLREGDHIQIDVTPEDFGRIAAQAAKQRITQGLRDAVRDIMIDKYTDKVGKIITGIVQRKDQNYVLVEIDKAEAIMSNADQIPGEFYRSSERRRFLLLRLSNSATDKRMVVSRASIEFLQGLFELEVPEIATGNVQIVNIAREAGSRSKVAVRSQHDKIDAIGACIGPRGTRIDSIMNEITPEKVDVIPWDKNIETYILNSLAPAKTMGIKINTQEQYAKVLVAEDMLSLAIGKDGQNVRLAAKLTGYKIDITDKKSEFEAEDISEVSDELIEAKETKAEVERAKHEDEKLPVEEVLTEEILENPSELDSIDLTSRQKGILEAEGITTIGQLKEIAEGKVEIKGFTKRDVEKLKSQLQ